MAHKEFKHKLIPIIFIAIIVFPILNSQLKIVKDTENTENRAMLSIPKFDIKTYETYPKEYENYYNDNFSIRSILVKFFSFLNVVGFKKTPLPDQVVLGTDGWLFSAAGEKEAHQGNNLLSNAELKAFKLELEYRQNYLSKRGCKFYFLIAPVKSNIYFDKIPNDKYYHSNPSLGNQLLEYLNTSSTVKPINVYNTLLAHKAKELVYYKIDDHWNQVGGFYAVQEVLKRFQKDFTRITTDSIIDYTIAKTVRHRGDLFKEISYVGNYSDYMFKLAPKLGFKAKDVPLAEYPDDNFNEDDFELDKEIDNSKEPRILIISDSFGEALFPFLSEHFSRSVKIFDNWQYKLNEQIVNAEKPDIVLLITWEANLRNILEHQSRLSAK